ncbi:hypothetical protein SDC9_47935 [bioreactor metagenome]|uniref:R3H domain-containing protein n=1 Tax=bioreactor metagenome TaxID=1076179 RepID=A0A644WD06_9ZZZZ
MLKWIEATGKNEEAAVAAALSQLGLDRDEVSVEVLDRAKNGFLGIGSAPARIKVSYEVPDEPEQKPVVTAPRKKSVAPVGQTAGNEKPLAGGEKHPEQATSPVHAVSEQKPAESKTGEPEQAAATKGEKPAQIKTFLTGLLAHMNVAAEPVITETSEGGYQVILEGENLGMLIGRRGETLDAIQQITNYAVNRGASKRVRVHIDAENYRAKREESLQRLAEKVAAKVVKYRRNVTLEPMNAYERHVIHAALQDYPDVATYSMGTEPNRRTVVAYSKGPRSL